MSRARRYGVMRRLYGILEQKIEKIFCCCQHLVSLIRSIGEHSEEEVEAMTKRRDRTFRNSYEQLLYEMARAGRLDR